MLSIEHRIAADISARPEQVRSAGRPDSVSERSSVFFIEQVRDVGDGVEWQVVESEPMVSGIGVLALAESGDAAARSREKAFVKIQPLRNNRNRAAANRNSGPRP